jgi:16S rRNA (guanine527-N7)-methyltransferase
MEIAQFKLALSQLGLNLEPEALTKLSQYVNIVQETNRVLNLTAHDSLELLYEKGLYDSLCFLLPQFNKKATILDLGSGAGFPGIPLKIVYPHLKTILLEATQKKAMFLQQVIKTLALKNIEVNSARAEVAVRQAAWVPVDYVVARAVASLPILLELSIPLLKVGGQALLYKGKDYLAEIAMSKHALSVLGATIVEVKTLRLPTDHEQRAMIIVEKVSPTPTQYPRMFSQIKKTPL